MEWNNKQQWRNTHTHTHVYWNLLDLKEIFRRLQVKNTKNTMASTWEEKKRKIPGLSRKRRKKHIYISLHLHTFFQVELNWLFIFLLLSFSLNLLPWAASDILGLPWNVYLRCVLHFLFSSANSQCAHGSARSLIHTLFHLMLLIVCCTLFWVPLFMFPYFRWYTYIVTYTTYDNSECSTSATILFEN